MKLNRLIFSFIVMLFVSSTSFAGWKDLAGNVAGKALGSADAGDAAVLMSGEEIMVSYVASMALINVAQIQVAEALGLTEQAQELKAQREFLESGSVPEKKRLKAIANNGKQINEDINAALAEGKELSAESKKKMAIGGGAFLGGIFAGGKAISSASNLKSDLMSKPLKAAKKIKTLTFVAKTGGSYLKSVKDTSSSLGKFFKANGMAIPSRISSIDELPDDI